MLELPKTKDLTLTPDSIEAAIRPMVNEILKESNKPVTSVHAEIDRNYNLSDVFDSLDIIDLTINIEDHYDIEIPDDTVENIKTYGQLVDTVVELLNKGTHI